jgi:integrase
MPRKARDTFRPWRLPNGARLGFIRSGIYWISRTVHGRLYRISTGCRTPEAAVGEYARFEADPSRYVPRGKVGTGWDQAAVAYVAHSESVELNSPRWVEKQASYLANFGAFTRGGSRVFASLDAFTANDIRAFIAALTKGEVTGRKVGAPTVNRHLAVLKGLMRWARETRQTPNEADQEVTQLREDREQRLPKELRESHWRKLLLALDPRWRAAAEVQLGAGLRYGEVAALTAGQLHKAAIHVEVAKGRRGRTVPTTAATIRSAKALLELGGVPDDEGSQFNHRLEVAAKRAGVPVVTTHAFRHTYAVVTLRALLRAGQGLSELQSRMGHASIKTTEIYLRAVRAGGGQRQVVGAPR